MVTSPTQEHATAAPADHSQLNGMQNNSVPPNGGEVEFLTRSEVASLLRIAPVTVLRLVSRRKLRAFRIARCLRFARRDVDAFLAEGSTEAKTPATYGSA